MTSKDRCSTQANSDDGISVAILQSKLLHAKAANKVAKTSNLRLEIVKECSIKKTKICQVSPILKEAAM